MGSRSWGRISISSHIKIKRTLDGGEGEIWAWSMKGRARLVGARLRADMTIDRHIIPLLELRDVEMVLRAGERHMCASEDLLNAQHATWSRQKSLGPLSQEYSANVLQRNHAFSPAISR